MVKVLLIKNSKNNSTGASLQQIEKYLKTEFQSIDYMQGFLDGYLFENYKVIELDWYQNNVNKGYDYTEKHYIKFINILD